jgi:hypothetical protein
VRTESFTELVRAIGAAPAIDAIEEVTTDGATQRRPM